MSALVALACVLGLPVLQAVLVVVLARPPGLRDVVHIGFSLAVAVAAAFILDAAIHHQSARIVLARPLPRVELAFVIEPLGALMAMVIAGLGVLHAVHASGMARAAQERAPARMMAAIALGYAAAIGAALSANLFSFFVAYQALTLATLPLVEHNDDDAARRAARGYLGALLTLSIGLFLPAMVWTYAVAGTLEFHQGGILAGHVDPVTANVLLFLYVLGAPMTALPPGHRWLPLSSGALNSALVSIQATCVLPVGAIGLLKIAYYVFGPVLHQAVFASTALIVLAGISMCAAALVALSKQDLRERLAYSAMAQSMAAVIGALLAAPEGAFAAVLQLLALTCSAATLMMACGNMFAATGWRNAADTPGLGRRMPWTFAAFAIGAASIIGMPPFAGAWAKLWLITAAADTNYVWAAVLAGVAAILTFAHLGPLAITALVAKAPTDPFKRPDGASILLVAPAMLSAFATFGLLVLADPLARYLAPLWSAP